MSKRVVVTTSCAIIGLFLSGCAFVIDDHAASAGSSVSERQSSGTPESGQSAITPALPDWSVIAERTATEAGTDQIVDAVLYMTGEARLTLRAGEGESTQDVTWSFKAKANRIEKESEAAPQPRSPVSIRDVDWATATSPFTAGCAYGVVTLSWLPHGVAYRDYSCNSSFATEAAWLDNNPIPDVPGTPDAAAFQQGLDFLVPIIGRSAVQFAYSKKNAKPNFTLVSPATVNSDGSHQHIVVNYEYAFEGDPVLKTQAIDAHDLNGVTGDTPAAPTIAFDLTSTPATSYAQAVAVALASKGLTYEDLQHAYFEAASDSEIAYSILTTDDTRWIRGTLPVA